MARFIPFGKRPQSFSGKSWTGVGIISLLVKYVRILCSFRDSHILVDICEFFMLHLYIFLFSVFNAFGRGIWPRVDYMVTDTLSRYYTVYWCNGQNCQSMNYTVL